MDAKTVEMPGHNCPICSSSTMLIQFASLRWKAGQNAYYTECSKCGNMPYGYAADESGAMDQWRSECPADGAGLDLDSAKDCPRCGSDEVAMSYGRRPSINCDRCRYEIDTASVHRAVLRWNEQWDIMAEERAAYVHPLPCPSVICQSTDLSVDENGRVGCNQCGVQVDHDTLQAAIAEWNDRPVDPLLAALQAHPAALEQLPDALSDLGEPAAAQAVLLALKGRSK